MVHGLEETKGWRWISVYTFFQQRRKNISIWGNAMWRFCFLADVVTLAWIARFISELCWIMRAIIIQKTLKLKRTVYITVNVCDCEVHWHEISRRRLHGRYFIMEICDTAGCIFLHVYPCVHLLNWWWDLFSWHEFSCTWVPSSLHWKKAET